MEPARKEEKKEIPPVILEYRIGSLDLAGSRTKAARRPRMSRYRSADAADTAASRNLRGCACAVACSHTSLTRDYFARYLSRNDELTDTKITSQIE